MSHWLGRLHLAMMVAWALLVIPTLLWWRESILWVAFMSLYANFVGHFSAWDASRAEQKADDSPNRRSEPMSTQTPEPDQAPADAPETDQPDVSTPPEPETENTGTEEEAG